MPSAQHQPAKQNTSARPSPWLLGLALGLLAGISLLHTTRPAQAQEGVGVHYAAGWNVVAAPTGTELEGTTGVQYASGTDGTGYQAVRPGEIIGGRAVWAYFNSDTTVQLDRTASEFTRIIAPPMQWVLAGNPSTTQTSQISGADQALAYDSVKGYVPVTSLAPGQGAWVVSFAGGDIQIGQSPSGNAATEIRSLQVALTQNAADASSFGKMPPIATELIQAGQFDQVQSMMDDLRAAFGDGLRLEKSAPLPQLSTTQVGALQEMRKDVSAAEDASVGGNASQAGVDLSEARSAATTVVGAAASQARATGGTPPRTDMNAVPPPANLAIYGGLCEAATPYLSLALAPSSDFLALVGASLMGGPLPPASTPTPGPSSPTSSPVAAVTPAATGTPKPASSEVH